MRFLKFGAVAWGGPVAQIAMIRQERLTPQIDTRQADVIVGSTDGAEASNP